GNYSLFYFCSVRYNIIHTLYLMFLLVTISCRYRITFGYRRSSGQGAHFFDLATTITNIKQPSAQTKSRYCVYTRLHTVLFHLLIFLSTPFVTIHWVWS